MIYIKITISELSRLIGVSRPTLYKYLISYENNELDDVPYSVIKLFQFIDRATTVHKDQIYEYCMTNVNFKSKEQNLNEILDYLINNDEQFKEVLIKLTNHYKVSTLEEKNNLIQLIINAIGGSKNV